jgi:nicotinate-nucleotide pyrophosphorylase (carboxylating)
MPALAPHVERLLDLALEEDLFLGDATSEATIDAAALGEGRFLAKDDLVLAGTAIAVRVFERLGATCAFDLADGARAAQGQWIGTARGPVRALLAAERTALNFLQRLCGVATLTRRFVEAVAGTGAIILDTRKTTPGLRFLEKYAVRCGGGENHRLALWDMYLVKDNHLRAAGGVTAAIERILRTRQGDLLLEVEVESLDQLREALRPEVDRILVDNRPVEEVRRAVEEVDRWCAAHPPDSPRLRPGAKRWPEVEVSGGLTLATARAYAETGVDYLSVGALTHSAPSLDLSLEVEEIG